MKENKPLRGAQDNADIRLMGATETIQDVRTEFSEEIEALKTEDEM